MGILGGPAPRETGWHGYGSQGMEVHQKIDEQLAIGNLSFSLPEIVGYDDSIRLMAKVYLKDRGYTIIQEEKLAECYWVTLERDGNWKPPTTGGNTYVKTELYQPVTTLHTNWPGNVPPPVVDSSPRKIEPVPVPKKEKPPPKPNLDWQKELDAPLDPTLPDHLFDLRKVNPVKLWFNKMLYKLRSKL